VSLELSELEVRGKRIPTARVAGRDDLHAAVRGLGLSPSPVLVLVGGAAEMSETDALLVEQALSAAIVPVVERVGATVVDGATRVGVMQLVGRARAGLSGGFTLVGVVVAGLVAETELDEHHTHFVLVPGDDWGDESELLSAVATAVADGARTVTVLANGGAVAWRDVASSVAEERPVIVLAGTGRTADELASAETPRARDLYESPLVTVVAVTDHDAVATAVADALDGSGG
jgi:SLOG in TRPM, prokaryote